MKYRERRETFNARSAGLVAPSSSSPFLPFSLPSAAYIEYTWPYNRACVFVCAAGWSG